VLTIIARDQTFYNDHIDNGGIADGCVFHCTPGTVNLPYADTSWGNPIRLHYSAGTPAEQWYFDHVGNGFYKISYNDDRSLCIDRYVQSGDPVNTYGCDPNSTNQPNQLWKPYPVGDGWYMLYNGHDAKALTVTTEEEPWPRLRAQTYTGSDKQKFRFYQREIWLTDTVEFGTNEWAKTHYGLRCPHPYEIEHEALPTGASVRYHDPSDGDGVAQYAQVDGWGDDFFDVWYRKTELGPHSGGIEYPCDLDARNRG
jgi:hypothetical protein